MFATRSADRRNRDNLGASLWEKSFQKTKLIERDEEESQQ